MFDTITVLNFLKTKYRKISVLSSKLFLSKVCSIYQKYAYNYDLGREIN